MSNSLKSRLPVRIVRIIFNKYVFVVVVFFTYLIFFDDLNLIRKYQVRKEIRQLEQEYQYFQNEIATNKEMIQKLKNDTAFLEKYAREKYNMKRRNEDIFIIKTK